MPRVTLGVILGLSIGIADVLLMLPLSFPDKRTALLAAFSSRFSLGFFAATINLRMSPVAVGLLVGLLTSIPDAIVTKAYAPILDNRGDIRGSGRVDRRTLGGAILTGAVRKLQRASGQTHAKDDHGCRRRRQCL